MVADIIIIKEASGNTGIFVSPTVTLSDTSILLGARLGGFFSCVCEHWSAAMPEGRGCEGAL